MSIAYVFVVASVDALGSGRTVPTLAALLGLISTAAGGLAPVDIVAIEGGTGEVCRVPRWPDGGYRAARRRL